VVRDRDNPREWHCVGGSKGGQDVHF
jgi:hypothetical protein